MSAFNDNVGGDDTFTALWLLRPFTDLAVEKVPFLNLLDYGRSEHLLYYKVLVVVPDSKREQGARRVKLAGELMAVHTADPTCLARALDKAVLTDLSILLR